MKSTKVKRVKKFKVYLVNREKDSEMELQLRYDVPVIQLGTLITFLEQFTRKLPTKKR